MKSLSPLSVLNGSTPDNVVRFPFPHFTQCPAIKNPDDYDALASSFPERQIYEYSNYNPMLQDKRRRLDLPVAAILGREVKVSRHWFDFVEYHSSNAFFKEWVSLFGDDVRRSYPWLEDYLGCSLEASGTTVHGMHTPEPSQIALRVAIGLNPCSSMPLPVRGPHVDGTEKLFSMLFYLRDQRDDSKGGELDLYQWKRSRKKHFDGAEVDECDVRLFKKIAYSANNVVTFVGSPDSVHGVALRSLENVPRRFVFISAHLNGRHLYEHIQKDRRSLIEKAVSRGLEFVSWS